MAIEKIKISQLTQTATKGLVIETVNVGGVPSTFAYDLNNITASVKGATFAGFIQCSQYIGVYIKPFISQGGIYDVSDKFFYILTGAGVMGIWDDNNNPLSYSQSSTQSKLIYWDGATYNEQLIGDNAIVQGSEVYEPQYIPSAQVMQGVEFKNYFDATRLPIFVRTWAEFVAVIEGGNKNINIFVAEDITADNTDPMQLNIGTNTETITIGGAKILDIYNLVLDSVGRSEHLTIFVNNAINLHSSYNYILQTGDKGSITFNVDRQVNLYVNGVIYSDFTELTNNQSSYKVSIWGNVWENYTSDYCSDINGNITYYAPQNNQNTLQNIVDGSATGSARSVNASSTIGANSFAFGSGAIASGDSSQAFGAGTTASGDYAQAFGAGTTASGDNSHAEGGGNNASGDNSHAEGGGNTASGWNSHAEGGGNNASGRESHAEGGGTIANHRAQHVFGENNIADTNVAAADQRGDFVEIVGNGTDNNNRSNARTLDWSGNEVLAGGLKINGTQDVAVVNPATSTSTTLVAGKLNTLGSVDYATIALPSNPGTAEYNCRFTDNSASGGDITQNAGLSSVTKWVGNTTIVTGKSYEMSIQNGWGIITQFD